MEMYNAKIKDAVFGMDDNGKLREKITFECKYGRIDWNFYFNSLDCVLQVMKLMEYARVVKNEDLEGSDIRLIAEPYNVIRAFGDPVANKFVPLFTEYYNEYDAEGIKKAFMDSSRKWFSQNEEMDTNWNHRIRINGFNSCP